MSFRLSCICCALALILPLVAPPASAAGGSLEVPVRESEGADAPVTEKLRLYSASKALVIGIDDYGAGQPIAGSSWPKLSKAIEDAEAVAASLEAKGFNVTLLKDLGADGLKNALEDFFIREGADPEARLLVWFAGHGHTIRAEGYLVPTDAPNPNKDEVGFKRKALSLRRFGEFMRGAEAKHVLAVFDSCFAGTIFDVARALPSRAITRATALKVRQFVSSGDADQKVSDNGRFRRLFLDALDGKEPAADPNSDGFITGTELGMFLSDKITNLSEKGQTPRYGKLIAEGFDRGDFVLEKGKLEMSGTPLADRVAVAAPEAARAPQPAAGAPALDWICAGTSLPQSIQELPTFKDQVCAIKACAGGSDTDDKALPVVLGWQTAAQSVEGQPCRIGDRSALANSSLFKSILSAVNRALDETSLPKDVEAKNLCRSIQNKLSSTLLATRAKLLPADGTLRSCPSNSNELSSSVAEFIAAQQAP